jgi:hypothetical protein
MMRDLLLNRIRQDLGKGMFFKGKNNKENYILKIYFYSLFEFLVTDDFGSQKILLRWLFLINKKK